MLTGMFSRTSWWIRFGKRGWGLQARHRSDEPLFSERHGYMTFWPKWPARWRFRILKPEAWPHEIVVMSDEVKKS